MLYVLNYAVCVCYRFGPRQIRAESAMLRACNGATGAAPYQSLMVADIGDVNVNMYDLKDTCKRIREAYKKIVATGCVPLTIGEMYSILCSVYTESFQRSYDNEIYIISLSIHHSSTLFQ